MSDRIWYMVKIKFLSIVANNIDILHLFSRLLAERTQGTQWKGKRKWQKQITLVNDFCWDRIYFDSYRYYRYFTCMLKNHSVIDYRLTSAAGSRALNKTEVERVDEIRYTLQITFLSIAINTIDICLVFARFFKLCVFLQCVVYLSLSFNNSPKWIQIINCKVNPFFFVFWVECTWKVTPFASPQEYIGYLGQLGTLAMLRRIIMSLCWPQCCHFVNKNSYKTHA